jgi:4-amino-4-deoxy-L-arabinose transferase-like glycosyltransferase
MLNKINKKNFLFLISFLTIVKFGIAYIYGDSKYEMEWAIIVKNLLSDNSFSYYEIDEQKIPTVYMPPLYAYIIYIVSFPGFSEFTTVKIILFFQCFFSGISIFFFYKILLNLFNERSAILFSIIYFLIPLNFYSSTQISSVSFQISIFIFFLYYNLNAQTNFQFIILGIFSGLAILIRGEFWLLFLVLIIYKIITNKLNLKKIFLLGFITVLIITPTIIRNYIVFNDFVLTKSSGYNLWRGNSLSKNINGENIETFKIKKEKEEIKNKLIESNEIEKYEIYLDKLYFNIAKNNIFNDPIKYIGHYINKFFAYSFFNFFSNYPNNFHPLILLPEIIISLFGICGILQNIFSKKTNYELLIITFFYLVIIPVFFVLPRYKLFIFPMYVIFSCYLFTFLFNKIFSKKQ